MCTLADAWYTGRIFTECWSEEGYAVSAVVALSALVIGFISLLMSLLLAPLLRIALLGGLHVGILTSWRWAPWGSFFDGIEKMDKRTI